MFLQLSDILTHTVLRLHVYPHSMSAVGQTFAELGKNQPQVIDCLSRSMDLNQLHMILARYACTSEAPTFPSRTNPTAISHGVACMLLQTEAESCDSREAGGTIHALAAGVHRYHDLPIPSQQEVCTVLHQCPTLHECASCAHRVVCQTVASAWVHPVHEIQMCSIASAAGPQLEHRS